MHSYLRAIGLQTLRNDSQIEKLLNEVFSDYDERTVASDEQKAFIEMKKEFGPNMGLILCGNMDTDGFHKQYYFPYFEGNGISTTADLSIEKRVNGDSYACVCDDTRIGISLIFFLQNPAAYQKEQILNQLFGRKTSVTFSCLSDKGMILLPVQESQSQRELQKQNSSRRSQWMNAAKNGDPEAIEHLTIEDMDLYSMVSRRIMKEDIYSIVDTSFMPCGIECDQYQIIGNILFYTKVRNPITKEYVYQLSVECNDMTFDICINAADLLGDPEVGRRFKGNIWLQGRLNFD